MKLNSGSSTGKGISTSHSLSDPMESGPINVVNCSRLLTVQVSVVWCFFTSAEISNEHLEMLKASLPVSLLLDALVDESLFGLRTAQEGRLDIGHLQG